MDVDVVVMGYLPSRWDSGDEATGPQMDEITTVVLARWPAPKRVRSPAPATPAAGRGSQCLDDLRACSSCMRPYLGACGYLFRVPDPRLCQALPIVVRKSQKAWSVRAASPVASRSIRRPRMTASTTVASSGRPR